MTSVHVEADGNSLGDLGSSLGPNPGLVEDADWFALDDVLLDAPDYLGLDWAINSI